MRSSACVVMATKAVAALPRNKMAGVVSLSLASSVSSSSPLLSPFSLVSVKWSRLVVMPDPPTRPPASSHGPSCPLTLLLILSIHPHKGVGRSLRAAGWVPTREQLVERADERGSRRQVERRSGKCGALKGLWSPRRQ